MRKRPIQLSLMIAIALGTPQAPQAGETGSPSYMALNPEPLDRVRGGAVIINIPVEYETCETCPALEEDRSTTSSSIRLPTPNPALAQTQPPLRILTEQELAAIDGGINLTLAAIAAAVSTGLRSLGADDAADATAGIGRELATGPTGATIHNLGTALGLPGSVP